MDKVVTSGKVACLEDLKRRILVQDLQPSDYLDEVAIGETYGISRPPVREVLRQLAGEGYVILHENRGAQVAPMSHKSLRNFFIVAPMIYSAVARLAAVNATPAHVEQLKQVQRKFRVAIRNGDVIQRALLNERFHAVMGDVAGNEYLLPSLRRLLIDHTRIGMTFYDPRQTGWTFQQNKSADQHDEFIELIAAGDAEGAAAVGVAHWEISRALIENFVTPQSIDAPLGIAPVFGGIGEK